MKLLQTDRLILRELTLEDAPSIFSIFSNEQVLEYYGMEPLKTMEQAESMIHHFNSIQASNRGMRFGIERKEEAGVIGTIGFNLLSLPHRRTEIGYELHPSFWGNGYASEALDAVLTYGFEELGLNRIGAIVFVENEASQRLLLKKGFEKEGYLKKYIIQGNKAHDVYLFGKIKP